MKKEYTKVSLADNALNPRLLADLKKKAESLGYGPYKFATYLKKLLVLAVRRGLDDKIEKIQ